MKFELRICLWLERAFTFPGINPKFQIFPKEGTYSKQQARAVSARRRQKNKNISQDRPQLSIGAWWEPILLREVRQEGLRARRSTRPRLEPSRACAREAGRRESPSKQLKAPMRGFRSQETDQVLPEIHRSFGHPFNAFPGRFASSDKSVSDAKSHAGVSFMLLLL